MSFTGKDELNGPAESIQETRKSVLVMEDQIRALVVCEPSGKSNSKGGRVQQDPMTFTGVRDVANDYFRTLPRFETAAPKYAFLNRLLAVGIGEIRPDGPIHTIEEIL